MSMVISHSSHHSQLLFRSGYSQPSSLSVIISHSKLREPSDKVQFKSAFLPASSVKVGTFTLFTLFGSICMLRDSQRVWLSHRHNSNVHQVFHFQPGLQTNQLGKEMGSMPTRSVKNAADTWSFYMEQGGKANTSLSTQFPSSRKWFRGRLHICRLDTSDAADD